MEPPHFVAMLLLLAVLLVALHAAAADDVHMAFPLPPDGSGSKQAVMKTRAGATVTCTFDFLLGQTAATPPPPPPPAASGGEGELTIREVWEQLQGKCVTMKASHWSYEACVGVKVRQFDGQEDFSLGQFERTSGDAQEYINGHKCGVKPRRSTVTLRCAEGEADPRLMSVEEPSTCSYVYTIAWKTACRAPRIRQLGHKAASAESQSMDPAKVLEAWYLEVSETDVGDVRCAVQNTLLSPQSLLRSQVFISRWALDLSWPIETVTARTSGRQALPPAAYAVDGTTVSSTSQFAGRLEYVAVTGAKANAPPPPPPSSSGYLW